MDHKLPKLSTLGVLLGMLWAAALFADGKSSAVRATNVSVSRDRIVQFIRDRFGVPDSVKMTVGPFRSSFNASFEEATVSVDDGKQKKDQNILVSKDGRYLIFGNALALNSDQKEEIAKHVREQFRIPQNNQLSVGALRKSAFPDFYETTVTLDDGKKKQTQDFFVSKDNHALVLGSIFNFRTDPRREALRTMVTQNQPAEGPANAPVTLVEYADLECPTCAHLHEFIEKELIPKYGDKVRVVFKDFPLTQIHDWALTAALASQCAYKINPAAFSNYRSLIFKNQSIINATNVRDMLLNLATQAGIDSVRLAACIDSKASLPRVEQNLREGKQLGVDRTPTTYINGKAVVGTPPPENFYQIIDEALRAGK